MSRQLHEELAELAREARSYADPEAALDRARRTRRTRWVVSAAAASVLVVTALVWAAVPGSPGSRPGPAPAPPAASSPAASPLGVFAAYRDLPATVAPPAQPPPLLPVDAAVGPAALAYQCRGCPPYLVLPDGTHYRLPDPDGDAYQPFDYQVTLSPDGRWLGVDTGDGLWLRDLTGTGQRTYPGCHPTGWSPDSRRLGVWGTGASCGGESVELHPDTGELLPAPGAHLPGQQQGDSSDPIAGLPARLHDLVGPLPLEQGELLVGYPTATDQLELVVLDATSGARLRSFIVGGPVVREGEALATPDPETGRFEDVQLTLGGGNTALVTVWDGNHDLGPSPVAMLLISPVDGVVVRVGAPPDAEPGMWYPHGYDGVVVLATDLLPAPSGRGLILHDPAGGSEVVSRLDSGGPLVLRGEVAALFDPDAVDSNS